MCITVLLHCRAIGLLDCCVVVLLYYWMFEPLSDFITMFVYVCVVGLSYTCITVLLHSCAIRLLGCCIIEVLHYCMIVSLTYGVTVVLC